MSFALCSSKKMSVVLAATALLLAPPLMPDVNGTPLGGAAFAKADKSKGTSNSSAKSNSGGSSTKGNSKKSKEKKTTKSASPKPSKTKASAKAKRAKVNGKSNIKNVSLTDDGSALRPNEKGKWNASNASVNALNAHIGNQNFNGTIGALAQYKLAATAASGEPLNAFEQRALNNLVTVAPLDISDMDKTDYLNSDAGEGDPVFDVVDGVVSCAQNCPEDIDNPDGSNDYDTLVSDTQKALDEELQRLDQENQQSALDTFLQESENRIIDESNKTLSDERNEVLLDDIAMDLGITRAPISEVIDPVVVD